MTSVGANAVIGKWHGVRVLIRMIRWLDNWRHVWSAYRSSTRLPVLRFRSGVTLHHSVHDDPIALLHEIVAGGCYRHGTRNPRRGVLVDIGANIGVVTLDWATRFPGAKIHAYEPAPTTCQTLHLNIDANGLGDRVTVYEEAVGLDCGVAKLWVGIPSALVTSYGEAPPLPGSIAIEVPTIGLDEVVRRANGMVSMLKIDAEGAEAHILQGAEHATLSAIDQIILEYHESLCVGALRQCAGVLQEAGFFLEARRHGSNGLLYGCRNPE